MNVFFCSFYFPALVVYELIKNYQPFMRRALIKFIKNSIKFSLFKKIYADVKKSIDTHRSEVHSFLCLWK